MIRRSDVLIIGGGMAGLACALSLPKKFRVTIISKTQLPSGSTWLAQGGMAAPITEQDSIDLHLEDTIKAGGGLVDEDIAREIISHGAELVEKLSEWGAPLKGTAGGRLGIEGGHSIRRVLHYKDRTGQWICEGLISECRKLDNIEILEKVFAINLITASREAPEIVIGNSGRCLGAYVLIEDEVITFLSSETVIATGGAGKVYRYTSNDDSSTGDGIAMAYRRGLPIRNMELYQFHPTSLFHPQRRNFLVTEALRGEGARLLNMHGERFMTKYDVERMELAPRDIVARAIDTEMKRLGHDHVLLDATHLSEKFLRESFPEVTEGVMEVGIEPWKEPIPVVPAAHYSVGGIEATPDGKTEMRGLRAIGESACTGFHGANRLGSNSLLEAGVMGILAARDITSSTLFDVSGLEVREWKSGRAKPLEEIVLVDHAWASLRSVMWDYVGIVRSNKRLRRALRLIEVVMDEIQQDYWSILPQIPFLELRNLATVCHIIVSSAMLRRESRGLHFTQDYPQPIPPPRNTIIRRRQ